MQNGLYGYYEISLPHNQKCYYNLDCQHRVDLTSENI